jgi:hypothetical protein
MTATAVLPVVDALSAGVVDYAGLFPPADLDMATAVRNYAFYRLDTHHRLLGRFVVPVARLDEFMTEAEPVVPRRHTDAPWRLSALVGPDVAADAQRVAAFNTVGARGGWAVGRVVIDAIEVKAGTEAEVADVVAAMPPSVERFVEIPLAPYPGALLAAVERGGAQAKIRTGGVTPETIPSSADLARFLRGARGARVAFKATAGLHHAVRGTYPLTYEPDAPRAPMHGFLNLFLAAAIAGDRAEDAAVTATLEEEDPTAFHFGADGVRWHDQHVSADRLHEVRGRFARSFGSCSFREPVDDLRTLHLL